MKKTTILKIAILLALIPPLVLLFYLLPTWVMEATAETVYRQSILFTIFTGIGLALLPYLYGVYISYKWIDQIGSDTQSSNNSLKYLSHITLSSYLVGIILLLDLPFVYVFAEEADAPGIILVFIFYIVLSFSVGYLTRMLSALNRNPNT